MSTVAEKVATEGAEPGVASHRPCEIEECRGEDGEPADESRGRDRLVGECPDGER